MFSVAVINCIAGIICKLKGNEDKFERKII